MGPRREGRLAISGVSSPEGPLLWRLGPELLSFGMSSVDAEEAARYVLDRVQALAPGRWMQGVRREWRGSDDPSLLGSPSLQLVLRHRIWRMGALEIRALQGLAAGTHLAERADRCLSAEAIVGLQAEGRRCLALLPEEGPALPGLEFALHDLRHLAKYFDPVHHRGQVGFFREVRSATRKQGWATIDAVLGPLWCIERDQVLSDMNGSSAFLWAALRTKLERALTRLQAAKRPKEEIEDLRAGWLSLFAFPPEVLDAARLARSRRSEPRAWSVLQGHFEARGELGDG